MAYEHSIKINKNLLREVSVLLVCLSVFTLGAHTPHVQTGWVGTRLLLGIWAGRKPWD